MTSQWDDLEDSDDVLFEELKDPDFKAAFADAQLRSALREMLTDARRAQGKTQKQLAELMETSQSVVSEFETGARDLYLSTLQRYARAVDAEVKISIVNCPHESNSPRSINWDAFNTPPVAVQKNTLAVAPTLFVHNESDETTKHWMLTLTDQQHGFSVAS